MTTFAAEAVSAMTVSFEKDGIIGGAASRPGRRASPWRRVGVWLAVGTLALVAGCSTLRLAYSQTPRLAYWSLDRMFDFDREQEVEVRAAIDRWVQWHRQHEVPVLVSMIDRLAGELPQAATAEQACGWAGQVRERIVVMSEAALPDAARIARQLQPAQLQALRERQRRVNEEFADEYLQRDPRKRQAALRDRVRERIEMIYGRLDSGQRQQLETLLAASPYDADRWNAERLERQAALRERLQQIAGVPAASVTPTATPNPTSTATAEGHRAAPVDDAQAREWLHGLLDDSLQSPREPYRRYQAELLQYNCRLAADVHNLTTPAQREHAVRTLRGWAADLQAVAAKDAS